MALMREIVERMSNAGEFFKGVVEADHLSELCRFWLAHQNCARAEWQPIETAPKDGSQVLVYLPEDRQKFHTAQYHPNCSMIGDCFAFDRPPATHWQPLPEPPLPHAKEGAKV